LAGTGKSSAASRRDETASGRGPVGFVWQASASCGHPGSQKNAPPTVGFKVLRTQVDGRSKRGTLQSGRRRSWRVWHRTQVVSPQVQRPNWNYRPLADTRRRSKPRALALTISSRPPTLQPSKGAGGSPPSGHSMISVARTSTPRGMRRPSALAVFRLITRSKVDTCSTGRSAGLVPRRIRST
jgi:hypothetical protein